MNLSLNSLFRTLRDPRNLEFRLAHFFHTKYAILLSTHEEALKALLQFYQQDDENEPIFKFDSPQILSNSETQYLPIEKRITLKTNAIFLKVSFGYSLNISDLNLLQERYRRPIVLDCTTSLLTEVANRPIGHYCDAGIYQYKNRIILVTSNKELNIFLNKRSKTTQSIPNFFSNLSLINFCHHLEKLKANKPLLKTNATIFKKIVNPLLKPNDLTQKDGDVPLYNLIKVNLKISHHFQNSLKKFKIIFDVINDTDDKTTDLLSLKNSLSEKKLREEIKLINLCYKLADKNTSLL